MDLLQGSVCTSGGYGTKFEASGKYHHLFDTATGTSSGHYIATSVFASSAMVADALSTALYVTPPRRSRELLTKYQGVTALMTLPDGAIQHLPG
jgi:thiamine biosynthesis lipoprotein